MRFLLVLAACSATPSEPSLSLGGAGLTGYHVLAGATAAVPEGELGFFLIADGRGGYRIGWTGSTSSFAGSVTTDVAFDPSGTVELSQNEVVSFSATNRIDFSGVPGASILGLSFVAESEPIYLDLTVAGRHGGFGLFFTGAETRLLQHSAYDPVAFTSP
jgi:hypothetical protein